jgi:heptosyltransferase-2
VTRTPASLAGPRSLIIAPQWIGDAVMTQPLVHRLFSRGEQVTVAALPWVAPVYRAMAGVQAVLELPFRHGALQWAERRALGQAWQGRFDRAYVCPNSLKSALLPWFAGVPQRIGYLGEWRRGLLTHHLPNPSRSHRPPMVAFYAALAGQDGPTWRPLQAPPPHEASLRPRLRVADAQQRAVLSAQGLRDKGHVVMAPGAEYGPAKRWPVSHFAALASQLDTDVVLLGSGKERDLCQQIVQTVGSSKRGRVLNLAGQTTLEEAFALIASARQVVSNDSGLMHVAAALDVPQVAIFGSSSPEHTPPLSPHAQVLWLKQDPAYQPPLDCAPCFKRECPLGHLRCLQDLNPERVLQALSADPVQP